MPDLLILPQPPIAEDLKQLRDWARALTRSLQGQVAPNPPISLVPNPAPSDVPGSRAAAFNGLMAEFWNVQPRFDSVGFGATRDAFLEYFNPTNAGVTFQGGVLVNNVNFTASPGTLANKFAAEVRGLFIARSSGTYVFGLDVADMGELIIGGKVVAGKYSSGAQVGNLVTTVGSLNLAVGEYDFIFRWLKGGTGAVGAQVGQLTPGSTGNPVVIPQSSFGSPEPGVFTFKVDAAGTSAANTARGITKDGIGLSWVFADSSFPNPDVTPQPAARSYNALLYSAAARTVDYAHAFDLVNFGTAATADSQMGFYTTGAGSAGQGAGQFGNGAQSSQTGTDAAHVRSNAASTSYSSLVWVELWFKGTGTGTVVSLNDTSDGGTTGTYHIAVIAVDAVGKAHAQAWTGLAMLDSGASTTTVNDGNWHHLAASINGTRLAIIVDGSLQASLATAQANFSLSPPAGGTFLGLGRAVGAAGIGGQMTGAAQYDELIVSNGQFRAAFPFTLPAAENAAANTQGAAFFRSWHFQEPTPGYFANDQNSPNALANLLSSYNSWYQTSPGDLRRRVLIVFTAGDPSANRSVDSLDVALAQWGANRSLFLASSFRVGSAYILAGSSSLQEANGINVYSGAIDNDTAAHASVTFQTRNGTLVAVPGAGGWTPIDTPGAPTNNPVPSSLTLASKDVGSDLITLTWTYAQPALTGTNKLADFFVVYIASGTTADPKTNAVDVKYISIDKTTFTVEAPHSQSWSFSVASARRTRSGVEIGPQQTSAAAPNWQGVGGNTTVSTTGVGDRQITSTKRQLVNTFTLAAQTIVNNTNSLFNNLHNIGYIQLLTVALTNNLLRPHTEENNSTLDSCRVYNDSGVDRVTDVSFQYW